MLSIGLEFFVFDYHDSLLISFQSEITFPLVALDNMYLVSRTSGI